VVLISEGGKSNTYYQNVKKYCNCSREGGQSVELLYGFNERDAVTAADAASVAVSTFSSDATCSSVTKCKAVVRRAKCALLGCTSLFRHNEKNTF